MTFTTSAPPPGPFGYDAPLLDVSVRTADPSALVIEVQGELDLCTGPTLKRRLEPYNAPSGNNGHPRKVTYLLPELGFMDASGLRALLTAIDGHGSETITIREPSASVCRLLELVGLASMIEERADQ